MEVEREEIWAVLRLFIGIQIKKKKLWIWFGNICSIYLHIFRTHKYIMSFALWNNENLNSP